VQEVTRRLNGRCAFDISAPSTTVAGVAPRVVALVASALAVAGCGDSGGKRPARSATPPERTTTAPAVVPPPRLPAPAITRELRTHFGVLRRARRPSDRLPAAGRKQLRPDPGVPDERGANPRLSRRVRGQPLWVVPGAGTICLVYTRRGAAGGGCAATDVARRGGFQRSLAGIGLGIAEGRRFVYGLVPDAIGSVTLLDGDGDRVRRVDVADNVWAATIADGEATAARVGSSVIELA
jgi:hypothetical protein